MDNIKEMENRMKSFLERTVTGKEKNSCNLPKSEKYKCGYDTG